jgi:misacylated tRNA(Ala) deacylase
MQEIILNRHNKQEFPPMHSAEHILNQTMIRMFGCDRSRTNHIEKKKSKCDYILKEAPTVEQIAEIENRVNEVISQNLPIMNAFVSRKGIPVSVDLSKLPEDAGETVRLVYIGDYDICACIGLHVNNTSEIGTFRVISTDYSEGTFRIRFRLD